MKILTTAFFVFTASLSSHAQSFEKDGYPCVKELCIGDGLHELQQIKWDAAKARQDLLTKLPAYDFDLPGKVKIKPDQITSILKSYKGSEPDIRAAAPYIYTQSFDNVAFPLIEKIQAACTINALRGRYVPPGGFPTVVTITLLPTLDGSSARWTITRITRYFPRLSLDQQQSLKSQVFETYKNFDEPPFQQKTKKGSVNSSIYTDDSTLTLAHGLNTTDITWFLKQPKCGHSKEIQLN